jgi:FkbM family methyltransferase
MNDAPSRWLPGPPEPRLVYDVGMNNGDDTAYYLHRGCRVVAVEANAELCTKAARRFADEVAEGRLVVVNAGIAAEEGVQDFWICDTHDHWSSFDASVAGRDGSAHHSVKVRSRTFESILEEYGVPFFLKVDIEGNDYLCIDALKNATALPEYLSVELGWFESFVEKLSAVGYGAFKCISQFHYLPLQEPASEEQRRFEAGDTSHVRRIGDWVFPHGASGPFGEDTFGRWMSAPEMRRIYEYFQALRKTPAKSPFWEAAEYSFWLDLHARREPA